MCETVTLTCGLQPCHGAFRGPVFDRKLQYVWGSRGSACCQAIDMFNHVEGLCVFIYLFMCLSLGFFFLHFQCHAWELSETPTVFGRFSDDVNNP